MEMVAVDPMSTGISVATAREVDQRVRCLAKSIQRDFLGLGDLLVMMDTERLWTVLKNDSGDFYQSFDSWMEDAIPKSRSWAYKAKSIISGLSSVPRHQLEQMTIDNMDLLRRIPEKKRTPAIIEAAQNQLYRNFSRTIEAVIPEEHLEANDRVIFNCPLSRGAKIREIVKWATIELGEAGEPPLSDSEALELALVEWQQGREGY